MIVSFRCRETEKVFHGDHPRKLGNIARVALRKLALLHAASRLSDLTGAGNALEALKGARVGQHAFRVNDQYRLCFRWENGNAHEVEIVDYHA